MTPEVQPLPTVAPLQHHSFWQDGQQPEPCVVVIFGATGDLTQRKLLPTLAHLAGGHPLSEAFSVVAFARRPMSDQQWRDMALASLDKFSSGGDKLDGSEQRAFARRI